MANQSLVRYVNERRVLTLLRVEEKSTRADIARKLSLTRSTITNMVDDLLRRNLVREMAPTRHEGRRELGRPGINVSLNPSGAYFLGAEIEVGKVRFALLDLAGNVAETKVIDGDVGGPKNAIENISRYLATLERKKKYRTNIRALGVTVPGLVRTDGFVIHLPLLGWRNVNLLQLGGAKTDIPLFIENNTNAAAFGEVYTHPRSDSEFIIYMKLGFGCGGAAILNGRLMRGASGTATEFGHIKVADDDRICSCGQTGCLESYINLEGLASEFAPGAKLSSEELMSLPAKVVEEAKEGRRRAEKTLQSITAHLTSGLVSLTNIFNPSEIVLGGIMRPILEHQLKRLSRGVEAGIVPGMSAPELSLSAAGEFECAIGAAAIAHHKTFDVSNIEVEVIESDPNHYARIS